MALQLGALRDALIDAGAKPETAKEAAEEVAGDENRLTRLTTMVQVMLAIGLLLLGSQAAIWMEIGKLNGSLTQLNSRVDLLNSRVDLMNGKIDQIVRAVVH